MPQRAEAPESKKECPSCGLGVPADARVCEFCGWDFEEEDEWIVQIEKLERDLLVEKQKFKPGTVDHMIESSLVTLGPEATEPSSAEKVPEPAAEQGVSPSAEAETSKEQAGEPGRQETAAEQPVQTGPAPTPRVRRVRTVKGAPGGPPAGPEAAEKPELEEAQKEKKGILSGLIPTRAKEEPQEQPRERKTRVVRKVKQ